MYATMYLLHVSCREQWSMTCSLNNDFCLADISHSTVWPKGSSDLVWPPKQRITCHFFLLTSSVWPSSPPRLLKLWSENPQTTQLSGCFPVLRPHSVVCPTCSCERSILAMNHPRQEGRQWKLFIGYSELGKLEQTCVTFEIWYNTWSLSSRWYFQLNWIASHEYLWPWKEWRRKWKVNMKRLPLRKATYGKSVLWCSVFF